VPPFQGSVLFVLPPGLRLLRSLALGFAVPHFPRFPRCSSVLFEHNLLK
jgi:hypothetical protein